ncbi:MAG: glycosyltransferase, partial [Chloroflexi bacterium]|nr:glycosyltransferase [Chloroflexota bacterium]
NTLLEAMACGCFPIAGDLESLREWITLGQNGLLVNPGDSRALADAILQALAQPDLRNQAVQHNFHLVAERAELTIVMVQAQQMYSKLAHK